MPATIMVYVCKDKDEAKKAQSRLVDVLHFPAGGITTHKDIGDLTYDSSTFGNGDKEDTVLGGYVVIGVM
jgi:hypothetical protein